MFSLKGCTALITGASSGFGAEFARQLAPHATVLILVARRLDRLEALRSELARPGLTIHCHAANLTDQTAIETLLAAIAANGARVDFLINNAGVGDHGLFENSPPEKVEAMLDLNVKALTRLTHAFVPQLVAAGRGAILNVSSVAGLMPIPKLAVYAATKAYVSSFSEALRGELRGSGVSVTAVCPGPVDTEFFQVANRPGGESLPAPEFLKVSPAQVVCEALRAVERDRARVIPGWPICIAMMLATLVPIYLLRLGFGGQRKS